MRRREKGARSRFTLGAAILVTVPLLVGAAGAVRYRAHGDVARFAGCGGTVCGGIDVQRGFGGEDSTYLWFNIYDYATGDYAYGYGRIPNDDLTVSSTASAALDTDTTSNPEMEIFECTPSGCARAPGGRITAWWGRNGASSVEENVRRSESVGKTRRTTVGVYRFDSADASGIVLGRDFSAVVGEVGSARSVDVRIDPIP